MFPEINVIDIADIYKYVGDEIAALVLFQINGGGIIRGIPSPLYTKRICHPSYQCDARDAANLNREMNEMDESALLEVGNIMVSAFLDGTAGLLNIIMLPSPPQMVIDMPHAALQSIIASQDSGDIDEVVLFRTELKSDTHEIKSSIFLFPNKPMLEDILKMLEALLNPGILR